MAINDFIVKSAELRWTEHPRLCYHLSCGLRCQDNLSRLFIEPKCWYWFLVASYSQQIPRVWGQITFQNHHSCEISQYPTNCFGKSVLYDQLHISAVSRSTFGRELVVRRRSVGHKSVIDCYCCPLVGRQSVVSRPTVFSSWFSGIVTWQGTS